MKHVIFYFEDGADFDTVVKFYSLTPNQVELLYCLEELNVFTPDFYFKVLKDSDFTQVEAKVD